MKNATQETDSVEKLGGHPLWYQVRKENEQLYSRKHYQYATDADPMSNFRLCGQLMHKMFKPGVDPTIAATLALMSKQIVGIYEIVGENKTGTIESLEDKCRDVEIYASILQVLIREKQQKEEESVAFDYGFNAIDVRVLQAANEMGKQGAKILKEVTDGPYCDDCEQLADFQSEDHSEFLCSNCLREKNLNPFNYFTLER